MLQVIFPPACVGCGAHVASDFGLCADCWRGMAFTGGLVCDRCGLPLHGEDEGRAEYCDDCLAIARPWSRGRAAFLYKDKGRELVLGLKHADRLDLVRPMADWLARAVAPILTPGMLLTPIPLHWTRLFRRRYNQAALLARALGRLTGAEQCPDLLVRQRKTESQDGRGSDQRFANLSGALAVHPRRRTLIRGRQVLLVDDVMTSGATFSAATDACLAAGASGVCVLALARVAKDT